MNEWGNENSEYIHMISIDNNYKEWWTSNYINTSMKVFKKHTYIGDNSNEVCKCEIIKKQKYKWLVIQTKYTNKNI